MRRVYRIKAIGLVLLALGCPPAVLAEEEASAPPPKLKLIALFKSKAIVMVNGTRTVLSLGKPGPQGAVLHRTDTLEETAEIEFEGKRQVVGLGYVVNAAPPGRKQSVTLYAGGGGFFHADGYINNIPVRFLVDTGASSIAMNAATAQRIGIDLSKGTPGMAKTASGFGRMVIVTLDSVEIGGLQVNGVEAGVMMGSQPDTPLLGMTFLGQFNMRREGDRMELIER